MQMPTILMLSIALLTGLVGLAFLFFPNRIRQLEERLNTPWGDRELASLRIGIRGEQAVEQVMNRNVLATEIVWDGWLRRHPRLVGVALCLLAMWFGWQL
jgi:ABC-type phosphate transport system permease subunit